MDFNPRCVTMRVKTTLEYRESEGAHDMSMIGAYSSDMVKVVRTAKPLG